MVRECCAVYWHFDRSAMGSIRAPLRELLHAKRLIGRHISTARRVLRGRSMLMEKTGAEQRQV
jgi:hypothetical protein